MLFYCPYYMIGASVGGILAGIFYHWLASNFCDPCEEEQLNKKTSHASINHDE